MLPAATKSKKVFFKSKGQSKGHKVIDLGVIWKDIILEYACQIWSLYL